MVTLLQCFRNRLIRLVLSNAVTNVSTAKENSFSSEKKSTYAVILRDEAGRFQLNSDMR